MRDRQNAKSTSSKVLPVLLVINLVTSALHFGDNMLRFQEYPEPRWITGPHVVDALWLVITPLLALGWWLARTARKWESVGVLWLYGVLSLFVLGHYLYAPPMTLSFRINVLIAAETVTAILLILLAPLSILD